MRPLQFGVTEFDPRQAYAGFTVFGTTAGRECRLIDMRGDIRKTWTLPGPLANYGQLLPNGNLLVTVNAGTAPATLHAGGGRILEIDWEGTVVWEHADPYQHHDFNRRSNGNTLYLAWELIATADVKVEGGVPGTEHPDGGIYLDVVREVDGAGQVVWEWHMAEHFPFDRYPSRANRARAEFAHANACFVCPDGNVIVSWRDIDLIALIDRATGKFIWEKQDRSWGGQHDPRLLDNDNVTLFANGSEQLEAEYSRVLELDPKTWNTVWEYKGTPVDTFFSARISGAQRLPNGNTLICEGRHGRLFEVKPDGEIVWEYISPFQYPRRDGITRQIFRALRYAPDSPEIGGRLKLSL